MKKLGKNLDAVKESVEAYGGFAYCGCFCNCSCHFSYEYYSIHSGDNNSIYSHSGVWL